MIEQLFQHDAYVAACAATVAAAEGKRVVLDRTVFYPAGGGQPGDRGELVLEDGRRLAVADTVKGEGGAVIHLLADGVAAPAPGTRLNARIDWPRRHLLMRYHTCLHLLCAVVGAPVTGGRMGEDKAHLDFDSHRILDAAEASGVFVASAETAAPAARRPAGSAT